MPTITTEQAKQMIFETNGKIFSCQFVKKDGSLRKMQCRLNVQKHLKGGVSTTAHIPHLITVFEMVMGEQEPRFRNINANTLVTLKVNGDVFNVADPLEA